MGKLHEKIFHKRKCHPPTPNSFDLTGTHRNANTQEVQTHLPEWLKLKNTHNNKYRERWEAREIHLLLVGIQIHITTVVKSGLNSSSWRYTEAMIQQF